MKKIIITLLLSICILAPVPEAKAQLAILEIIKAGVKKVIKAVDLKIQRQQNKVIWLQNAQKVIENAMAKLKLNEISEWTDKQKQLYAGYFDELKKVRALISYYQRIKEITNTQARIVEEYRRAWSLIKADKHFTLKEIEYIGRVYSGILDQSVKNLDQLFLVINSFKTEMSDGSRLKIMNEVSEKINGNYQDLRGFNAENVMLSVQRSKDEREAAQVRKWYGLTP
ncbi:conjugal transfer protein TraI [Sphingobacterium siyangense]|uniref:conjugal transfer protein TraI n=1 Tax=Sphingobacterium siyangense TaxID=459529 RepID=UPI002FDED23F